jgi:hypothetical protein
MSVAEVEKILGVSAAANGSIRTGVGTNLEYEIVFTSMGRIYEMWRRETFLDLPETLRSLRSKKVVPILFAPLPCSARAPLAQPVGGMDDPGWCDHQH